tara:strand:+ start:845 stop:1750 length:906 start_codon:yes stop_codon:yes gene_type:complete
MKTAFCTISTNSHLFKVDTLFESLKNQGCSSELICLATQTGTDTIKNGRLLRPNEIDLGETGRAIRKKHNKTSDHLRWSLKPVLIRALLEKYDKVIYLDNDLFFVGNPSFLWEDLEQSDVLLTPHHYPRSPKTNQNWLEANFKVGLYNAGFIAVNKKAISVIDWWAECCLYRCEKSLIRGLFDDQKYLDLFPIIHPNTKVLEHRGCNVAGWNTDVCERTVNTDGTISICDKWPLIFVHFNGFSVRSIIHGGDVSLKPYLDNYVEALQNFKPSLELGELWNENTLWDRLKLWAWRFLDRFGK